MRYTLLLVFALCSSTLHGALIVGNSVTSPFPNNGTSASGGKYIGFTTGLDDLLLDSIDVALGGVGLSGGTIEFTLNGDSAGLPGAVISTIGSQSIGAGSATAAYTLTPLSSLLLQANTTYWVGATFNGTVRWDQTDPPAIPSDGLATFLGYRFNGASSGVYNAILINGRVDGGEAAIPEPATMALMSAALVLLIASRRATHKQS